MAENRAEVLAGAVVLAVAGGVFGYSAQLSGLGPSASTYPLVASFRSAEGITVGSDDRLAGVKVGTITGLTLNPTTYMADANVALDKSVLLPTDSAILISSEGLLGGNFVELVPGGSPDNLAPGDEIEDTQGAVSLITLLMKFVGTKVDPPKADAGATP